MLKNFPPLSPVPSPFLLVVEIRRREEVRPDRSQRAPAGLIAIETMGINGRSGEQCDKRTASYFEAEYRFTTTSGAYERTSFANLAGFAFCRSLDKFH